MFMGMLGRLHTKFHARSQRLLLERLGWLTVPSQSLPRHHPTQAILLEK